MFRFFASSPCHRFKCNTDWAAIDTPGVSGCGGIFRDHHAFIVGCFSYAGGHNAFICR